METPHYQIILIDDDYVVSRCGHESLTCLPVYKIDDLRFQVLTDFSDDAGGDLGNFFMAIVCTDGCSEIDPVDALTAYGEGLDCGSGCPDQVLTENLSHLRGNYIQQQGSDFLWDMVVPIGSIAHLDDGQCFSLCLFKITYATDFFGGFTLEDSECLGTTNCFRKISDLCYTTKIKYQYNETSMGFYRDNPVLTVRLPMYLSRPQFPGEQKGYQKSDGTFLKLSERINKEWTLTTDWLPEALHERIRVALSADFIQIWNENENLALEGVYRDAEYDIQWHEEVDYPLAKATTKIKKRILQTSVNSNCA